MSVSKKIVSVFLSFVMFVVAIPMYSTDAFATGVGDFEYEVVSEADKTAEITNYTGSGGDVVIPETLDGYTVVSIGDLAFGEEEDGYMDFSVTSLSIPKTVEHISEMTTIGLVACSGFIVDDENESFSSIDGVLFDKNRQSLIRYPSGKSEVSYTVPNSVTDICYGAFSFSKLNSVVVSNGVQTVADYAFSYSSDLEEVVFSDSVVYIGEGAFDSCELLKTVILSNSLTKINGYVFYGCRDLTEIIIPSSVTSIDASAFMVSHLTTVYGVPGSYAETFANNNNYEFIDVNASTVPGDMNNDFAFDNVDIDIMFQIALGIDSPTSAELRLGDVNNDGVIDGFDISKLECSN